MNLKPSLILLGMVVLAVGAYFFTKTGDGDQSEGMQNGISAAEQSSEVQGEENLVGDGNAPEGGEAERQVIPQQATPEPGDTEAAPAKAKVLNEVFAQVTNDEGEALEGIEVAIRLIDMEAGFDMRRWESPDVVRVKTDEEGRVGFKVSSDPFVVRVAEPGFVARDFEFPAGTESGEDLGVWALSRALSLSGQVVGPNGQPVAGAKIIAPQEGGFVMVINGKPDAVAETDAAGRFTINTLEPGSWRLLVHSTDFPDRVFTGEATTELQQGGLIWTLNEGAILRGRLTGRPAFNTQELIVRMDLAPRVKEETLLGGPSEGFPRLSRRVDLQADGTFALAGLHPETKYNIRVLEEGKGMGFGAGPSLAEDKIVSSSEGTVDLIWSTKAGLQLTVLDDETSLPVEEYTLTADDYEYYAAFEGQEKHPEGRIDMGGIPISTKPMAIKVEADGYEPFTIESVEFHSGNVTNLGIVRITPGKLIRIHVVDATTGKSVKGARIDLTSMHKQEEEESEGLIPGMSFDPLGTDVMHQGGKTDAEGMVSLRYMDGTTGTIKARHTRFAKAEMTDVELSAFRKEPLKVELWKGGALSVLVVDANNDPVKGVKVELKEEAQAESEGMVFSFSSGPMLDHGGFSKNTNRKGLAKFKHVPAGDYRCTVAWPGSSAGPGIVMVIDDGEDREDEEPKGQAITIKEGGNQDLTMAAPLRSSLTGTIMENGTPLVGARITVAKAGGPRGFGGGFGGFGQDGGVRTDRDGHYVVEDLDPGKKVITVHHDARIMDFTDEIKLDEGENQYSAELQVTTVSGRVLDVAGNGIEGIRITAEEVREEGQPTMVRTAVMVMSSSDDDGEGGGMEMTSTVGDGRKPTITDAEGRFELRGVLPNKGLRVVAEGDKLTTARSKEMTIPDGSLRSGVVLTMAPGCELIVKVVDAQGAPVAHALVEVNLVEENGDGEESSTAGPRSTTNNKGEVTFDSLKAKTYEIAAYNVMQGRPDEPPTQRVTLELLNPKTIEIEIDNE